MMNAGSGLLSTRNSQDENMTWVLIYCAVPSLDCPSVEMYYVLVGSFLRTFYHSVLFLCAGLDFVVCSSKICGVDVTLKLWDTAGAER